jgi:hypothetical protein
MIVIDPVERVHIKLFQIWQCHTQRDGQQTLLRSSENLYVANFSRRRVAPKPQCLPILLAK